MCAVSTISDADSDFIYCGISNLQVSNFFLVVIVKFPCGHVSPVLLGLRDEVMADYLN